jgi:phage terminase large subunit
MRYEPFSILLKAPEEIRQTLFASGVYGVNDCFLPLYDNDNRFVDMWGGRAAGRSHTATDYIDYILENEKYCRVAIVRLNHSSIRDSLWRDFKDRIESKNRNHLYDISDYSMRAEYKKTGNLVVAKGVKADSSQTAKMKSLAGFTHVIIEEADEIPKEDFRKLKLSIRKKGVNTKIIRLFNPPSRSHHIWDDYNLNPVSEYDGYYTAKPKKESNILSIFGTYLDNIHNLDHAFISDLMKDKDNASGLDNWLRDGKGYISSGIKGQIFTGWNRITLEEYNRIEYNKYYYIDWGGTDPCAIGEVKAHNNQLIIKPLHYEPKRFNDVMIWLCEQGFTSKETIIVDSAIGEYMISKMRNGFNESDFDLYTLEKYPQLRRGFTAMGVVKKGLNGKGFIETRIEIMKGYNVSVVEGTEGDHLWNEYTQYVWMLDKDGKPTGQPIDKNNHHIDGSSYVAYALKT